jgi:hypothetical protein
MRFKTTHLFLAIPLFLSFQACSSSEGGKGGELKIDEKKHVTPEALSALEKELWGDTISINKSYDLYFDFSATMKRAVNDATMKELITTAFDGLDPQDRIYSIGENKAVKEITGDKAAKQNSVLGPANYVQTLTFMTPNINNIVANATRPAVMFTDFSVDEGRPTTDADGVSSYFVRGSEYAKQFESWFSTGGSIRVYGKYLAEAGVSTPVYVIAFLPNGYDESHRVSGLLTELDAKLSKDFAFNFHTHIGDVVTAPNGDHLSDANKMALNGSNKSLNNGYGELMKIKSEKFINAAKEKTLRDNIEKSIYTGISFKMDSTCFLTQPEFNGSAHMVTPESETHLKIKDGKLTSIYKSMVFDGQFNIGIDCNKAKQSNMYPSAQLMRYHISISKVAKEVQYNTTLAKKALQYQLGKQKIMNNCLLASLEKAMKDCANNFSGNYPLYSVYTYVRK